MVTRVLYCVLDFTRDAMMAASIFSISNTACTSCCLAPLYDFAVCLFCGQHLFLKQPLLFQAPSFLSNRINYLLLEKTISFVKMCRVKKLWDTVEAWCYNIFVPIALLFIKTVS